MLDAEKLREILLEIADRVDTISPLVLETRLRTIVTMLEYISSYDAHDAVLKAIKGLTVEEEGE